MGRLVFMSLRFVFVFYYNFLEIILFLLILIYVILLKNKYMCHTKFTEFLRYISYYFAMQWKKIHKLCRTISKSKAVLSDKVNIFGQKHWSNRICLTVCWAKYLIHLSLFFSCCNLDILNFLTLRRIFAKDCITY